MAGEDAAVPASMAAGVPVIKFHEARHSAISLMHDVGVRDDIMREAGHADLGIHARYTTSWTRPTGQRPSRWPRWSARRGSTS